MLPAGRGRIINIGPRPPASPVTRGSRPTAPAAAASTKQLTMSLAADRGLSGVTWNCLAPGWFKTAQNAVMYENAEWVSYLSAKIPLRRPGAVDDLTGTLLFLSSDASAYITGLRRFFVDGGISVNDTRAFPRPS